MVIQIQCCIGYRVVHKATAVIITFIEKPDYERFPKREFRHIPVWENE